MLHNCDNIIIRVLILGYTYNYMNKFLDLSEDNT